MTLLARSNKRPALWEARRRSRSHTRDRKPENCRVPALEKDTTESDPLQTATRCFVASVGMEILLPLFGALRITNCWFSPSPIELRTQRPGRDDQALDFAGTFVNLRDAGVAVGAFNRVFAAVAVAAMDLHGFVRDTGGHFAGEKFCHGGVHAEPRAGVLLPGGLADQQASSVNLRGHVGQHELNCLKLSDGMTEGEAFFRIFQGGLQG